MSVRAKRFAVIGDPVEHSLSPSMHRAAFDALGLPHDYQKIRVDPEELAAFLDRIRRGEFAGANVTVPHKVDVLALCDVTTDEANVVGAVNTLVMDSTGRLVGSNTDVDGLYADLVAHGCRPQAALVLGAGGAARAAVLALDRLGARVSIAARRDDQAAALTRSILRGTPLRWDSLDGGDAFDLVVNATSAGMLGGPDGEPIAAALLRTRRAGNAAAYDLVYRAPAGHKHTPFLARAASLGMPAFDGLGMLVEQGARALRTWLGMPIDETVKAAMRAAVAAAMHPSS